MSWLATPPFAAAVVIEVMLVAVSVWGLRNGKAEFFELRERFDKFPGSSRGLENEYVTAATTSAAFKEWRLTASTALVSNYMQTTHFLVSS